MDDTKSLRELAIEYDNHISADGAPKTFEEQYFEGKRDPSTGALAIFILIFIFFALIFWAGLALGQPSWCLSSSSGLDNGKAFGAALLIAFFVLIVVAVIWALAGGINGNGNGWGLAIALIVVIVLIIVLGFLWYIFYSGRGV